MPWTQLSQAVCLLCGDVKAAGAPHPPLHPLAVMMVPQREAANTAGGADSTQRVRDGCVCLSPA